jgi:hypothetical protein
MIFATIPSNQTVSPADLKITIEVVILDCDWQNPIVYSNRMCIHRKYNHLIDQYNSTCRLVI